MKYLHDDSLAEITALLTDCPVSNKDFNSRIMHGRLECYSMKRAGNDKKYAVNLSSRFTAEQEALENDLAQQQLLITKQQKRLAARQQRKRSVSTGEPITSSGINDTNNVTGGNNQTNNDTTTATSTTTRGRSNSLTLPVRSSNNTMESTLFTSNNTSTTSAIVNRRLLTDMILTLNHSFPDYDFAEASPSDFVPLSLQTTVQRINERLSEVAVQQDTTQGNNLNLNRKNSECFLSKLWRAIDNVIHLSQVSTVYSYQPDDGNTGDSSFLKQLFLPDDAPGAQVHNIESDYYEGDYYDGDEGDNNAMMLEQRQEEVLWSFNYFFVNKTAKRILLFTCIETMQFYNSSNTTNSAIPENEVALFDSSTSPSMTKKLLVLSDPSAAAAAVRSLQQDTDDTEASEEIILMNDDERRKMNNNTDDSSQSSAISVDFDMDPADTVPGGIPIG